MGLNVHNNSKVKVNKEFDYEPPEFTFTNMEGRCYYCDQKGHQSPQCRLKDKLGKEKWTINKSKQSRDIHVKETDNSNNTSKISSLTLNRSKHIGRLVRH